MKRFFCLLLALLTLLALAGCRATDSNRVRFYYSRLPELYQYFEEDAVIHSESRDLAGHRQDLRYMVGLYLAGPLEEGLRIPFTKSTRLLSVEKQEGSITITLSDNTDAMTDAEFSLACAGLTLTCMDFTACNQVTVTGGKRSVTMDADSILLFDSLPTQETTGGS